MAARFCRNCGAPVGQAQAFCVSCGSAVLASAQTPAQETMSEDPANVKATEPLPPDISSREHEKQQASDRPFSRVQQGTQDQGQKWQQTQTNYLPNGQAQQWAKPPATQTTSQTWAPPPAHYTRQAPSVPRRVTTAKASGLIFGIFALVIAAVFLTVAMYVPAEDRYSIADTGLDVNAADKEAGAAANTAAPVPPAQTAVPAPETKYGEAPSWVLEMINKTAAEEDYHGNYTGTVTIRNENIEAMGELMNGAQQSDIIESMNNKTYNCTAELDGYSITMFSSEVPSEILDSDGSFYYISYEIENGVSLLEESDYDDEMKAEYSMKENAYFLTDGTIYVINAMEVYLDDGRYVANELRFTLTPAP